MDTIAVYRDKLRTEKKIVGVDSMLIVVGREDTGELEAQVRGSRHAWDMRLISVDALAHLVKLKESTEDATTGAKIRSVLVPKEYTRLDGLIDVLFTAAKDVETSVDGNALSDGDDGQDSNFEFTDPKLMQAKRDQIVTAFATKLGTKLVRKSRALYWDAAHSFRVASTVSKRYTKKGSTPYWYAYHPAWDEFLADGSTSHFVLGCMDLGIAFAVPLQVLREHLDELNTTTKPDGTSYWHVKIIERKPNSYLLHVPKSGKHLNLDKFAFDLG